MLAFNLQPTLTNELVIVRPLQQTDFDKLFEAASDPAIWEQHPAKERSQVEGFTKFFTEAMETNAAFAIIDKETGEIIGSSRYYASQDSAKAIEIGWTFIARKYWGGTYNKAVKQLMLEHAFNYFELVLFFVDRNNTRSRKAVEKIGGREINSIDGVLVTTRSANNVVYSLEKERFANCLG